MKDKNSCCHKGIQTITTSSTITPDKKPVKVCSKCKYTLLQFYGSDQLGSSTPEIILGRGCVGQDKYIAIANSGYGHYRLLFKYESTHTIVFGPNTTSYHLLYTEHGWEILEGDRNTFTAGISNVSLTTDTWKPITDPNGLLPKDSSNNNLPIFSYGYINISNPILLPLGGSSPVQAGDRLIYTNSSNDLTNQQLWYRINSNFVVQKVLINNDNNAGLFKLGDRIGKTIISQNSSNEFIINQYDSATDSVSSKVFLDNTKNNYLYPSVNWDGNSIAVLNTEYDTNLNLIKGTVEVYDTNVNLIGSVDITSIVGTSPNFDNGMSYNTNIALPSFNNTTNTTNKDNTIIISPNTSPMSIITTIASYSFVSTTEISPNFYFYPIFTAGPEGQACPNTQYTFNNFTSNVKSLNTFTNTQPILSTMNSEGTDIYVLTQSCSDSTYTLTLYSNQEPNGTGRPSPTTIPLPLDNIEGFGLSISFDSKYLAVSTSYNPNVNSNGRIYILTTGKN